MTREEMMALNVNDLVTSKSGALYRVYQVERKGEPYAAVKVERGVVIEYTGSRVSDYIIFKPQREGEDHGAVRSLKPENIKRA